MGQPTRDYGDVPGTESLAHAVAYFFYSERTRYSVRHAISVGNHDEGDVVELWMEDGSTVRITISSDYDEEWEDGQ